MMGPEPMRRIFLRSVRLGMPGRSAKGPGRGSSGEGYDSADTQARANRHAGAFGAKTGFKNKKPTGGARGVRGPDRGWLGPTPIGRGHQVLLLAFWKRLRRSRLSRGARLAARITARLAAEAVAEQAIQQPAAARIAAIARAAR